MQTLSPPPPLQRKQSLVTSADTNVASQRSLFSMMNDTNHSFVIQGFDAFPSTLGQGDIVATHARVVDLLHSSTLKADEIDDVVSQFKQTGAVLNQNKAMATQSKKAIEANPKWLNRNDAKPLGNPTSPEQKKC